jgi:hypothetical protein
LALDHPDSFIYCNWLAVQPFVPFEPLVICLLVSFMTYDNISPLHLTGRTIGTTQPRNRRDWGKQSTARQQGIAFVPLTLESFGGVLGVAVAELRKLAAALARHTGQEEAEACRHLFSRLSILANRIPSFPGAQRDGDRE